MFGAKWFGYIDKLMEWAKTTEIMVRVTIPSAKKCINR